MARGRELAHENALLLLGSNILCCAFNSYLGSRSFSASARYRDGELVSDETSLMGPTHVLRVAYDAANNLAILVGDFDRDTNSWQVLLRLFEAFAATRAVESQYDQGRNSHVVA